MGVVIEGGDIRTRRSLEPWKLKPLGEMATFRTGPFGSALHKSDYTLDGIPVINPMHINNGKLTPSSTMTITNDAADKLSEFRLKCNEVIIGRRGEMGRCAVVKKDQDGWLCGTGSMIVRPLNGLDPTYLRLMLSDEKTITDIEEASVGSTMLNLNQATLSNLSLPFPPLPEQKAIAAALSDTDELIAGLEALVAKKRAIKQGAMQQLLTGHKRLPGFEGEWEEKRLDEVTKVVAGGTPSTQNLSFWDGEIKWCTPTDLTARPGKYLYNTQRKITSAGVAGSSATLLPPGTLLFCSRASVGEIKIAGEAVTTNQGFQSLVCGAAAHNEYLYYLITQSTDRFLEMAKGSTFLEVSGGTVKSMKFNLPPLPEQQAIAAVLSDMDAEIESLQTQLGKTRALKQGMMQELLTGRIRLV